MVYPVIRQTLESRLNGVNNDIYKLVYTNYFRTSTDFPDFAFTFSKSNSSDLTRSPISTGLDREVKKLRISTKANTGSTFNNSIVTTVTNLRGGGEVFPSAPFSGNIRLTNTEQSASFTITNSKVVEDKFIELNISMGAIQGDIPLSQSSDATIEFRVPKTDSDNFDIVYENLPYDPKIGNKYIKSEFVPNTRIPTTIGGSPTEEIKGLYVITPYVPADAGPREADNVAETIMNSFSSSTVLDSGVIIERVERQRGFYDAPWYYTPIIVSWRVYN